MRWVLKIFLLLEVEEHVRSVLSVLSVLRLSLLEKIDIANKNMSDC